MIQMKWRADSENSENSALDTIIVTHKIYEKKYFLIGLTLLLRIEQLNNLLVYTGIDILCLDVVHTVCKKFIHFYPTSK